MRAYLSERIVHKTPSTSREVHLLNSVPTCRASIGIEVAQWYDEVLPPSPIKANRIAVVIIVSSIGIRFQDEHELGGSKAIVIHGEVERLVRAPVLVHGLAHRRILDSVVPAQ